MLAAISPVDYGVLFLYLGALFATALYFSGRQKSTTEFFLASRTLGWWPLGMSLVAVLVSAEIYTGVPGVAYERGLLLWVIPAALWLILPIVVGLVIPIVRGLRLTSIYAYLELRFDSRVRFSASLVFAVWRLAWLLVAICLPARALAIATGWPWISDWWLVVLVGIVTTLYTVLGGMRAVVWTGLIQAIVMPLGVLVVVVGVWVQLNGGPARVGEIAEGLGRMQATELRFSWHDEWSLGAALPHWLLAGLSLFVADQVTSQRLLAARSVNAARTSYAISTLALSFLLPGLMYAGLCLLAFYYDHPQALKAEWVVNVDGVTRQPLADAASQPLLDVNDPAHEVRWENIDRLVAERRILRPNNKQPFTRAEELIDPETNRVLVERLAMRRPPSSGLGGEWIVRRGAPGEMLAQFTADFLPWGAVGLVVAALLGAAMSSIGAGLHGLTTLLVVDFHRRYGWGRAWLAQRHDKQVGELNDADEMRLAQPLLLILGLAATVLGLALSLVTDAVAVVVGLAGALAGPLLALFLLGMLTRRTTAAAAFWATILGVASTFGLAIFSNFTGWADAWPLIFGTLLTCTLGYALSFVLGRPKPKRDLRGLVAGCGTLGVRDDSGAAFQPARQDQAG